MMRHIINTLVLIFSFIFSLDTFATTKSITLTVNEDALLSISPPNYGISYSDDNTSVTSPSHGSAYIDRNKNKVQYRPTRNYCGQDSFIISTINVAPPDGRRAVDKSIKRVTVERLNVSVNITCLNDRPIVGWISNQTINEDNQTNNIAFNVTDIETNSSNLRVTRTSSNTRLIPTQNIILTGSGSTRYVKVIPAPNQFGSAKITISASDGQLTGYRSFWVTVNSINDRPVISSIANKTINEDTNTGNISFTITDAETSGAYLSLTKASSNTQLIPTNNIVLGGRGNYRYLKATPTANRYGSALITVNVSDGTLSANRQFWVTVKPINDRPTISGISSRTINEDSHTGTIGFTVADIDTSVNSLTLSRSSSNQSLVPNGNISVWGTGTNRYVKITPKANQSGSALITVNVSDSALSASRQFWVTVNAINDRPTISGISSRTINEDSNTGTIGFTVGDIDTSVNSLTLSRSSNNQSLVPNGNISVWGTGANRYVKVTPKANQSGSALITVNVSDGALLASRQFWVTVKPINDRPTIGGISNRTINEDSHTGTIGFTVGDIDTSVNSITLSRTSSNQSLVPTGNISVWGTGANRYVKVTPKANQSGVADITVTASDGNLSASRQFRLTVNAINDGPTISAITNQTINEDSSTVDIAFTVTDVDNTANTLTLSAYSHNQQLIPNANINLDGGSHNRYIKVTPKAEQSGSALITVNVSDGALTASRQFNVTVTSVNDKPTMSVITDQTLDEDTHTGHIAFTIGDIETPEDLLILSRSSSNQHLVPTSHISVGGTGANRYIKVTPKANQHGSTIIGVNVSDGQLSANRSFVVKVNSVDDPTIIEVDYPEFLYTSQSLNVSATASDVDSNITAMQFSLDGSVWHPINDAPYQYNFGQLTQGNYQLQVKAVTSDGETPIQKHDINVQQVNLVNIDTIADTHFVDIEPVQQQLVGEIAGQASVSGGAFNYDIPITIASGRKGMQPSVSLNYNSQNGRSLAGIGWRLSAYSSINRCHRIYDIDGASYAAHYADDKLCLNGTRLVAVTGPNGGTQGAYGQAGTYYKPERNGAYYVKQIGGTISDPDTYFVQIAPDGKQHFFGQNNNSRIVASGLIQTSSWLQTLSQDVYGNQINYVYDESVLGNRYLQHIYYTGDQTQLGSRKVSFHYDTLADEFAYHWGGKSVNNKRLNSITLSIDDQLKTRWQLDYAPIDEHALNPQHKLTQLQYCDMQSSDGCLTTEFDWIEQGISFAQQHSHSISHITDDYLVGVRPKREHDYDGDGINDLSIPGDAIYLSRTGKKVPKLPGYVPMSWPNGIVVENKTPQYNHASRNIFYGNIDYNLDGLDDIVYTDADRQIVIAMINIEGEFKQFKYTGINATCFINIDPLEGHKYCNTQLLDLNGDGRSDMLVATNLQAGNGNSQITYKAFIRRTHGDGFDFKGQFNAQTTESLVPMDVDGDGITDLVPSAFHNQLNWYKLAFDQSTQQMMISPQQYHLNVNVEARHRRKPSQWVDLNGDGLSDILTLHKVNPSDDYYTRHVLFNRGDGQFTSPQNTQIKELAWGYSGGQIAIDLSLPGGEPGYIYNDFIQFIDINGDGRQDILYPDKTRRKYTYECWDWQSNEACLAVDHANAPRFYEYDVWYWNVLITEPDGLSFRDVELDVYGALSTMQTIDITGDGRLDFLTGLGFGSVSNAERRQWYYGSRWGTPSDYPVKFLLFAQQSSQETSIERIKTGMGIKAELSYSQLKQRYQLSRTENDYPYVNFGNTMQVVSQLRTDNGVGSFNRVDYHYKNARFHVAGRGFQGFGEINETHQDGQHLHQTEIQTQFAQTYPWTGMITRQMTRSDGGQTLLSDYQVLAHYPNAQAYVPGESWCYYPAETKTTQWHTSPNIVLSSITKNQVQNEFCQATSLQTVIEDATTRHSKRINQTYTDANRAAWSVLKHQRTESEVVYHTQHNAVSHNPDNTHKAHETTYTYQTNAHGVMALSQIKQQGDNTDVELITQLSDYDKYGHPRNTQKGERWQQVAYEDTGYFVEKTYQSQWPGVVVSHQQYDPLTGQITSDTDLNGITTQSDHNFIGQPIRISQHKGNQPVSPPIYFSYQWQTGEYAYRKITQQSGQPELIEYFDAMKRPVKQQSQGFSGNIISKTEYDARGNVIAQILPTNDYGTQTQLRFEQFDVLGRPQTKSMDNGSVKYQSQYTYVDGLRTDIHVMSQDYQLNMSRTYNSLKQLLHTRDALEGDNYFNYDAAGLPVLMTDVSGAHISAFYDDLGRKAWFDDPNMGRWTFQYNVHGEVETQTDARGMITHYRYDKLGRMLQRGERYWEYDTHVGLGRLYQARVAGAQQTYQYDAIGRQRQMTTVIDGQSFIERTAYDGQYHRVKAVQFASGEHVAYQYNSQGFVTADKQYYNDGQQVILRQIEEVGALGGIQQQRFSHGLVQKWWRNNAGQVTDICASDEGQCDHLAVQTQHYGYDSLGNLSYQHNAIHAFREDFNYDKLMRVRQVRKTINDMAPVDIDFAYDGAGNITLKSDYGQDFRYGNATKSTGGNAGPNAVRQVMRQGVLLQFDYDNNGNRLSGDGATLTYNDDNKPLTVVRHGVTSEFSYDAHGMRYKQIKRSSRGTETLYYIGATERKISGSDVIDTTYIGDHTIKTRSVSGSIGAQAPFVHVLRDRLGSVDTLVNATTGQVLQYRGYDVFGKPRDIAAGDHILTDWQGVRRGFTDHEHLNEQQLIHMNGRIYDFNLGRFLSVDPFIQFPDNSQSLNPYSYILNNPMSGTDPTGYLSEGNECTTGSNAGFRGFCTSIQLGNDEGASKKKKPKSTVKNNGGQNESVEIDWSKISLETFNEITGQGGTKSGGEGGGNKNQARTSHKEKGFYGEPLTRIPSTLHAPAGEENIDRIEEEIIDSWSLDLIIGKNWRSAFSSGADLPDVRDVLSGHSIVGGQTIRGGSPVSFGMEMHVDFHEFDVKIEQFRRVRVRGKISTFRTHHKALSPSGEVMRFDGKPLVIDNTIRTPLKGTYFRYKSSTGQKLGTQKWPTPLSRKLPLR